MAEYQKLTKEISTDNRIRYIKFGIISVIFLIYYNVLLNNFDYKPLFILAMILGIFGCYCKHGFLSFLGYLSMIVAIPFVLYSYEGGIVFEQIRYSVIDNLIFRLGDLFNIYINVSNGFSTTYLSLFMAILFCPYLIANYISIIKKDKQISSYVSSVIVSFVITCVYFFIYYIAKNLLSFANDFIISMVLAGVFTLFPKNLLNRGNWKRQEKYKYDYCQRLKVEIERESLGRINNYVA